MHKSITNLIEIKREIKSNNLNLKSDIKIIAVSKTFSMENILPLIDFGHIDFGENKVQEALEKWSEIKNKNSNLNLHMIGKLQTNKVKQAVKIFDFIHSLDSLKLAKKISEEQIKIKKNLKIFIQINIGDEIQKNGIKPEDLSNFYQTCINDFKLDIIGLMCLPPNNLDSSKYFKKMINLAENLSLKELSMGMSSDYLTALEHKATFVRVGSKIFGERS
ncbi:YggS family pyridoxal phosphate-dependent enzyme [Pelagibacterales bacterium SAG-MED19]|nr:YggS family pyridoxal phosphate-dependent enzyme [Pelagibacterales bacterium SAG-MED19]